MNDHMYIVPKESSIREESVSPGSQSTDDTKCEAHVQRTNLDIPQSVAPPSPRREKPVKESWHHRITKYVRMTDEQRRNQGKVSLVVSGPEETFTCVAISNMCICCCLGILPGILLVPAVCCAISAVEARNSGEEQRAKKYRWISLIWIVAVYIIVIAIVVVVLAVVITST